MRVGIATDHGGFGLKEEFVAQLRGAGHEVVDFGAHSLNPSDDYPDFVIALAKAVVAGNVERGVAICGSGVGASVCANKIVGARAGLLHDHFSAKQGVEDDMNIICMGGRTVDRPSLGTLSKLFLRPSTVKQNGTCGAWQKWLHCKSKLRARRINRVRRRQSFGQLDSRAFALPARVLEF